VWVGNLNFRTEDWQLEDYFMQFGEVTNVRLITDLETGRSRGFAFVSFDSEGAAKKAEQMADGEELDGRSLRVNVTEPRERRPRTFN